MIIIPKVLRPITNPIIQDLETSTSLENTLLSKASACREASARVATFEASDIGDVDGANSESGVDCDGSNLVAEEGGGDEVFGGALGEGCGGWAVDVYGVGVYENGGAGCCGGTEGGGCYGNEASCACWGDLRWERLVG